MQTLPLYQIQMTQTCQRAIGLALEALDELAAGHGPQGVARANAAAETVRRELHTACMGHGGPVHPGLDQAGRALALYQAAMMFVFGGKSVDDAVERTGVRRALTDARTALPDVSDASPTESLVPGTTRIYTSLNFDQRRRFWIGDPSVRLDLAELDDLSADELRAVAAYKEAHE